MNCKEALFFGHDPDPSVAAEVRTHMESCASCRADVELDVRLREALQAEPVDSTAVDDRIRAAIKPSRRWMGIAAAVAAAVVVGVIGFQAAPDRTCAAAAVDHHREVIQGERRSWLLDTASIVDLAGDQDISIAPLEGYRLQRGKLCRLNGRVFLHLVYSDANGDISIFLRQHDPAAPAPIRTLRSGSENIAYFDSPHVNAIVVTDESAAAAARMAAAWHTL